MKAVCLYCKKTYSKSPYYIKQGRKYCDKYCRSMGMRKRVNINCANCGKEFETWPSCIKRVNNSYCSQECAGRHIADQGLSVRRGKDNNKWKGGITPINLKIRHSPKYKKWRTSIFERDDYTCQLCGVRGSKLNADHIKRFSTNPKLRFDIKNGQTLCMTCHTLKTAEENRLLWENQYGNYKI